MARNVMHSGKVSGSAQIESGEPFGTTFQRSTTHAPTLKGSSTSPKGKIAPNGIVPQASGPTVTCNDPAIDFPSRPAKKDSSKTIDTSTSRLEASGINTVGTAGVDGGGRKGYGLAKSYDKKGRTDKTSHSLT